MRLLYVLRDAVVGVRRNWLVNAAVVASVAVSLALLGATHLIREQVDLATDQWYEQIEVSIFLCDGARCASITAEQREQLGRDLQADPLVDEVFYESKEEAYQQFVEQFADDEELVEAVPEDALPASFRVSLTDPNDAPQLTAQYSDYPGVEEIVDQRDLLETFFAATQTIQAVTLGFSGVQLLAASVLIGNVIRVSAYARRQRTGVMKLVGASNAYVRAPFVAEGVLTAAVGAVLGWSALWFAVPALTDRVGDTVQFMPLVGPSHVAAAFPLMLATGVGIAAAASLLALRRHLDV